MNSEAKMSAQPYQKSITLYGYKIHRFLFEERQNTLLQSILRIPIAFIT